MRAKDKRRFLLVLSVFIIFLINLSSLNVFAQEAKGVLKIGLTCPLSGAGALWGQALERATRIFMEDFNLKGGIKIDGKRYTMDLVVYDDGYIIDKVVANVRRLIYEDRVNYIFVLGGAPLKAVAPIVEEAKILTFGFSNVRVEPTWRHIFLSCTPPTELSKAWLWVAKNRPNIKRVATLAMNDEVGWWCSKESKANAEKAGLTIVAQEFAERGTTDFTPMLRKIILQKVDGLDFCSSPPGSVGLMVKQARELGWQGTVTDWGGAPTPTVREIAGPQAFEGGYLVCGYFEEPFPPAISDFKKKWIEKYGLPFSSLGIDRSNSINILINALERTKNLNTEKMSEIIRDMKFNVLYGPAEFFGEKEFGIKSCIRHRDPISEVKKGVATIVGWTH
jgi:branched-chain amino acid transport system substrate-binding protein